MESCRWKREIPAGSAAVWLGWVPLTLPCGCWWNGQGRRCSVFCSAWCILKARDTEKRWIRGGGHSQREFKSCVKGSDLCKGPSSNLGNQWKALDGHMLCWCPMPAPACALAALGAPCCGLGTTLALRPAGAGWHRLEAAACSWGFLIEPSFSFLCSPLLHAVSTLTEAHSPTSSLAVS